MFLVMLQTSSGAAGRLRNGLAGENPQQMPMGAPGPCRAEGWTLFGYPPSSRALGARLQAGRNHLAWGFHGKPISGERSLLCGVNLSEVGFAAGQRASPELPEPSGLT